MISEASATIELAQAVADTLSAATLSMLITVERRYVAQTELDSLTAECGVRIFVVPTSISRELTSRNATRDEHSIDVGIFKRLRSEDNFELDGLMALAEEVVDHFRFLKLDTTRDYTWVGGVLDPIFQPDHVESMRQFSSVARLTYLRVR